MNEISSATKRWGRDKKKLKDMSSKIRLRPYHPDDYAQVVKIYQDGIKEVNTNVYQSFYNGLFPQLIFCELLAFSVGYMVGLHCFNSSHFEAIIFALISLLLFCCLSPYHVLSWCFSPCIFIVIFSSWYYYSMSSLLVCVRKEC